MKVTFEIMVKGIIAGETHEEIDQDFDYYLKKNPRSCVCCGKQLTAEDVWGSQGWHCQECWNSLVFTEDNHFYCAIHDKDIRYIEISPLFDPRLLLDNLEDW